MTGTSLLFDSISPGSTGSATLEVTAADTAAAMGSGDVAVLGTPRLVALCEQASLAAIAGDLPEDLTSVGRRVQIDHLSPTAVGGSVVAEAMLEKVEGRRLIFTVSVSDRCGLVAAGRVTRVVVDREDFLTRAAG